MAATDRMGLQRFSGCCRWAARALESFRGLLIERRVPAGRFSIA